MTEPEGLTAALLQLAGLAQKLSDLDHRESGHTREIHGRMTALATQVNSLKADLAGQAAALASVATLDQQMAGLAAALDAQAPGGEHESVGYQPSGQPRWWQLDNGASDDAIVRLRAWVEQVYRPGYGHLSASLGDCWDQHPLCLYVLDWLSELWSALYLTPGRTTATLASQAEWHIRLLPAATEQLTRETRRCGHAARRMPGQPEHRP